MGLVKHPSVLSERVETEIDRGGFLKEVLVVVVNIPLSELDPNFDRENFDALALAVKDAIALHPFDRAHVRREV